MSSYSFNLWLEFYRLSFLFYSFDYKLNELYPPELKVTRLFDEFLYIFYLF